MTPHNAPATIPLNPISSNGDSTIDSLEKLNLEITACTRCPRLVEHRQWVAFTKRRMYMDWDYWGKPLIGFGDSEAQVLVVGLAPAAHGGNRTGRIFTGDRSGQWLYETLYKFGFASSPDSVHRDDGLALNEIYITAAGRCPPPANKPLPQELANCRPYLLRELTLLKRVRVVVALGKIAFDAYLTCRKERREPIPSPRPKFGHRALFTLPGGVTLLASYHPSQQNTLTGRLTRDMFEGVFADVRRLLAAHEG